MIQLLKLLRNKRIKSLQNKEKALIIKIQSYRRLTPYLLSADLLDLLIDIDTLENKLKKLKDKRINLQKKK